MTLYLATDNQPNTFRKERITQATAAGILQMVGGAAAALGRGHPGDQPLSPIMASVFRNVPQSGLR